MMTLYEVNKHIKSLDDGQQCRENYSKTDWRDRFLCVDPFTEVL